MQLEFGLVQDLCRYCTGKKILEESFWIAGGGKNGGLTNVRERANERERLVPCRIFHTLTIVLNGQMNVND